MGRNIRGEMGVEDAKTVRESPKSGEHERLLVREKWCE